MIEITVSSSISVQPPDERRRKVRRRGLTIEIGVVAAGTSGIFTSPVTVLAAVEGRAVALAVHVVHVPAAPAPRARIVLIGAQAPLVLARHRIDRHAAQELEL